MEDREIIHAYLKSLSKFLSRLDDSDADDVLREIESHIYDALEAQEKPGLVVSSETILAGFGSPRELAAQYVDHILEGAAPPKGFKAIQRVKQEATRGLYLATGIFGYGLSLAAMLVGLSKLIMPDRVGIWTGDPGHSFVVGLMSLPSEQPSELLGWWLVPITFGLGIGTAYLTTKVLGVLKQKL